MSQNDTAHAWWSRLRHQGLLLSPVVMIERYPSAPPAAPFYAKNRLRDAHTRFGATVGDDGERDQAAVLSFVDAVLEQFIGHDPARLAKQHSIPEKLTIPVRIGSKTETIRPHRVLYADNSCQMPALLVMADPSAQVGRGRGRTKYAHLLELLRGTGHRLGLLTNGQQFRLVYAGLDFESWCEWESDRWFDDGEGTEELLGLRQLLASQPIKDVTLGIVKLLDAVEESRKRQADLSSVLRENVRQAVEYLLDEVSTANRTNAELFKSLVNHGTDHALTDAEAHEALMQATVRVVMRLVVCLFAESRQLLPVNDPIYAQSYGVRTLYELLDEAARVEGGTHVLFNRQTAWPRLMALFRLIHGGSAHGGFPLMPYGGVLFRPGDDASSDAVARALHILEHRVTVGDSTIYYVLRKLLRGPLPVIKGKSKTFVEGPVDYTDLRTEFIGLIYEGLLDYRLKRTDEHIGPQIFLNLGREPVLPLSRLTDMLAHDKKGLKDLLTTLRKEKVTASAADEEDEEESTEEGEEPEEGEEEVTAEVAVEADQPEEVKRTGDYLDAVESAVSWAKEAVLLAGLVTKQGKKETDSEYQTRIETEAKRLIKRVVAIGEFYLVRAGNTRKGTGTFYTRPQLAVPITHRTLEPLGYDKDDKGILTPKPPETILGLKVCDPACGSASFLVAALHYLTDALYKSLCHHRKLDDPEQSKKITLPFGLARTNGESDRLVPFPPNDPQRGHTFAERVKALLRRHVVERCIYGVDINPLAVELARVSLWVETLDPELPFSFLDHKIKAGNSLVGCWLDRVEDYPLKAWEREGGDGAKGQRTQRIETLLKGEKVGNRRTGDGQIKREMREVIQTRLQKLPSLFPNEQTTTVSAVAEARAEYETLHDMPVGDPEARERFYREHIENSPTICKLKEAMDEWCAVWFWPTDENSLTRAPMPRTFHAGASACADNVLAIAGHVRFFHWELEFPDAFSPQRQGFDAMIGNPPWEVMKPNSQEFFSDFDPLYRLYDKQAALRQQGKLFANIAGLEDQWAEYNARFKALANWAAEAANAFDVSLARGNDQKTLKATWEKHRQKRIGFADPAHPFRLQGSADLNSYKLFAELFWCLLQPNGRLGVLLPTGIYADFGTRDLRDELLSRGRLEYVYAFQNEKRVFSAAHHWFKQVALIATKGQTTTAFRTRFRMGVGDSPYAHEIPDDMLRNDSAAMMLTPEDVRQNSPNSLSFIEFRNTQDVAIFRKVYSHSMRIGEHDTFWTVTYATEFHTTNDSKLFPPLDKWVGKGYRPDAFGRWIGPEGQEALPVYQGGMLHLLHPFYNGWTDNQWRELCPDVAAPVPRFLMAASDYMRYSTSSRRYRIAYRRITNTTNTRTFIGTFSLPLPSTDSLFLLLFSADEFARPLAAVASFDSLTFDWVVRQRMIGTNLSWFILQECPVPKSLCGDTSASVDNLAIRAACLCFIHRRFAPEWLKLRNLYPQRAGSCEWKSLWAVTEADRLRLRVEIDALVADLYGLDPEEFDWIVRSDPKNPKGFYRVDRQLPFRERLTGLAAAAFRALKKGKWSAESAATLTNDEFFEIIGIPEMTTGKEPLILKRDGCHRWKPEEFGKDDPRYGWTWDHCWQDAVALLGSEDAVKTYVYGGADLAKQREVNSTDLFGNPVPMKPKQGKLF